jgi:hypothetical protein
MQLLLTSSTLCWQATVLTRQQTAAHGCAHSVHAAAEGLHLLSKCGSIAAFSRAPT